MYKNIKKMSLNCSNTILIIDLKIIINIKKILKSNNIMSAMYENQQPNGEKNTSAIVLYIAVVVVIVAVQLLLGKYLWNTVLVQLVPSVTAATSVWQILGLMVLVGILFGGVMCAQHCSNN